MSSYLVAFANGDFAHVEGSYKSPLSGKERPLRVYGAVSCRITLYPFPFFTPPVNSTATPDIIHQAHFALEVKAKALPLYEQVFDVEFPLPKLDTLVVCSLFPFTTLILKSTLTWYSG